MKDLLYNLLPVVAMVLMMALLVYEIITNARIKQTLADSDDEAINKNSGHKHFILWNIAAVLNIAVAVMALIKGDRSQVLFWLILGVLFIRFSTGNIKKKKQ